LIDETNLLTVDKSYILPDFSGKEADLVYRQKLDDQDIIFYVLMELQSTVDFQMPYRLLLYQVEIWRDYLKDQSKENALQKDFRMPAIIPMVLYNGDSPWTTKRSFREMISKEYLFGNDLIDFKYLLFDVQRYTEAELLELSNVIGSVFLLEQKADLELLISRFRKLSTAIQLMPEELQQRFMTWFTHILSGKVPKEDRPQS
jgi:hypothetical protein